MAWKTHVQIMECCRQLMIHIHIETLKTNNGLLCDVKEMEDYNTDC
jgi:hypothetical protein